MYCTHQNNNLEINETDTGYELSVPVPGVSQENLEIEVHEGILRVAGTPSLDIGDRKRVSGSHYPENYEQRLRLGRDIDPEQIQATLRNGILSISLSKKGTSEPRKIDVG